MNCEECNIDLLALAYGELEPLEAEEARQRVLSCAECQAELARLQALRHLIAPWGNHQYTPSPGSDAMIVAAAEARLSGASVAASTVTLAEPDLWERTVRWLTALAMGPQAAMATIMLLAIGIGLWYFPRSNEHDAASTGGTVIDMPQGSDIGASVRVGPPDQGDLEMDTDSLSRPAEEAAPVVAAPEPTSIGGAGSGRPPASPPPSRRSRSVRPGRAETGATAVPRGAAAMESEADFGSARTQTAEAPRDRAGQSRFQRGVERQARGDYPGAIDDFQEVVRAPSGADRTLVPDALRRMADSYQSSGRCDGAVPQYESLLRRFPSYRQTGDVQVDLARCYSRLGRVAEARTTLEQAARSATARRRAQNELRSLDARNRAAVAAPAGTPATADTAASEDAAY